MRTITVLCLLAVACSFVVRPYSASETVPVVEDRALAEGLEAFEGIVGHAYEIDSAWLDGTPIWSRNEFSAILDGAFVEARTLTKDNGEVYERYRTVYAHKAGEGIETHGFTFDGTVTVVGMGAERDADGHWVLSNTYQPAPRQPFIRQTITLDETDAEGVAGYGWKVWMRAGTEGDWMPLLDARWHRSE